MPSKGPITRPVLVANLPLPKKKKNGKISSHGPVKLHTHYLANEQKTGQCIKRRVPPSLKKQVIYPPENIVFRLPAHKWVRFH